MDSLSYSSAKFITNIVLKNSVVKSSLEYITLSLHYKTY